MTAEAVRNGYRNGPDGRGGPERPCPVCGTSVIPARATYCSLACRLRAFRIRHQAPALPTVPLVQHSVIYECPACEQRFVDERRCPACNLFCRRLGPGGPCPHCDEAVAVSDLLGS